MRLLWLIAYKQPEGKLYILGQGVHKHHKM